MHTNSAMQEALDAREQGTPTYYPPDNTPVECPGEHMLSWMNTGLCHYQVCSRCGKVFNDEETHEPSTSVVDGCIIVDEKAYVVIVKRCKCRIPLECTYFPLHIDESVVRK